jgi:nitrogen fixation protein
MTTQQQADAYRFFAIAFGAAPGVTYMNQIADAYAAGWTTKQIVNEYTTKPQFTSVYPTFFTNAQFANALIENVVGSSASAAAKAEAKADVEAALASGMTRGDVIYQIFNNLANMPSTDAKWGNTAKLLANQVEAAKYYTEVKLGNATDLAVLKSVIANVTPTTDVSTDAAKEAVLAGSSTGHAVTVTTGVDNITLTNAQKSIVGIVDTNNSVSTLNAGDVIIGTGVDGDELRVIQNAASYPGSATITDVDTITVQLGAGSWFNVNFNATGVTGAKQIIMKDAVADQFISNIGSLSTAVGITNTTKNLNADWSNALLTGSNDAVTVLLDTATGGANQAVTVSNGVEVVNVKTSGGKSDIGNITDGAGNTSLKTINVAADAALNIRSLDSDITTFDASASTAGVSVGFGTGKDITATGGKGDDRFTFGLGDFTDKDKVTGGDGTDRLDVTLNANLATKNQISGIETISASINGDVAGGPVVTGNGYSFNLSGDTDIKTFIVRGDNTTGDTLTLTNAEQVLQTVGYEGKGTSDSQTFDNLTVNLAPGKGTGSSDATTVVVNNKDASGAEVALATGNALNLGTLTLPNVENATIDVQAKGNANLVLSDTALTSLTLKATGDLSFMDPNTNTFVPLNSTKLTTVDATGVNGKLTIDTSTSHQSVTISLGNGNNVVTVGDGDSADDITTVNLGTGGNTIKVSDHWTAGANGFFIANGFNAGVGGDLITFLTSPTTLIADTKNLMKVTGPDEATLVKNFTTFASGDSCADGDFFVVQGNDNNAYIFHIDKDNGGYNNDGSVNTTGNQKVDSSDVVQLIGVLNGVKVADLVAGNGNFSFSS